MPEYSELQLTTKKAQRFYNAIDRLDGAMAYFLRCLKREQDGHVIEYYADAFAASSYSVWEILRFLCDLVGDPCDACGRGKRRRVLGNATQWFDDATRTTRLSAIGRYF